MLHIKLKGITKCSNMVANIFTAEPRPRGGVNRSKFIFSEHGHVAYQIQGNHECNNMVANILQSDVLCLGSALFAKVLWGKG